MSCITVKNLSIGHNKHIVLNDLNFSIEKGDYFCVVGENGVGKSTLIKTLLKLIPSINGDISFTSDEGYKCIGYLPQKQESQSDFPSSVMEVVLSGFIHKLGLRPFYSKTEKQIAVDNLRKLKIEHLMKKSFNKLSGGQQQRVLLARAICSTDKILLLDEPCASLDINAEEELYKTIKELNDSGTTIIMITHNFDYIKKDANKIFEMTKKDCKVYNKEDFSIFYKKKGIDYECN